MSLENLEQDEVLLMGFKLILFRIVDFSSSVKIDFVSDRFNGKDGLSEQDKERYSEFFKMKEYNLNKREIMELYGEMMTSAQLK